MSHSLQNKQDKLTAGTGISINGTTINATVDTSNCVKVNNGSMAIGSFTLAMIAHPERIKSGFTVNDGATTSGANLWRIDISYWHGGRGFVIGDSTSTLSGTWANVSGRTLARTKHSSDSAFYLNSAGGLWQRIS